MDSNFVQIHYLTAYSASLLNRDDVGMAKRLPYGGRSRVRVSSQCLKRHWRTASGEHKLSGLGVDMSVRSRLTFENEIASPLISDGRDPAMVRAILGELQAKLLGQSEKRKADTDGKKKAKGDSDNTALHTSQIIVLGRPEIEYITKITGEIADKTETNDPKDAAKQAQAYLETKAFRENLAALQKALAGGLDAAVFGRMVTSDILARSDAAVHVAHAFTVHAEEVESDYFTAVDDLTAEAGELGSGHLGETELAGGLFYGYVVVDIPLLVENLGGDRALAGRVVEQLVHIIATVSPGAKLGSTAPYAYAHMLLSEIGASQPRTLAAAFLEPVSLQSERLVETAVARLGQHLANFDRMYGNGATRQIAALTDVSSVPAEDVGSIEALASRVRQTLTNEAT